MSRIGIVSFRLGASDGISVAAANWRRSFEQVGHDVLMIAGEGSVDRLVRGLSPADAPHAPSRADLDAAFADCDVVVVDNLLTLPLHLGASRAVAAALRDRP